MAKKAPRGLRPMRGRTKIDYHVTIHPTHYHVIRDTETGKYFGDDGQWRDSWGHSEKFITIGPTDGRRLCSDAICGIYERLGMETGVMYPQKVYAPGSMLTDLLVKRYGITRAEIDAPGLPVVGGEA